MQMKHDSEKQINSNINRYIALS